MNGKGDTPRPTNRENYCANYDVIKWKEEQKKLSGHCPECGAIRDPVIDYCWDCKVKFAP